MKSWLVVHGYLLWRCGHMQDYTSRGGKYPHQNEPIQPGVQQVWDCQLLPQNPLWAQARLLKEKTKCFVGFWHRRSLLQRSAILHYSAGWEDSAWCWQGPLSDTSRSHAVGSLLSWQEGSTANWTIVGDVVNWFCSGFTGVVPNCKAPVQVFQMNSLVWIRWCGLCRWKGMKGTTWIQKETS